MTKYHRPYQGPAMQVKNNKQDAEPYATKYSCSSHSVTYYVPANYKEACPVCDMERQLSETKKALRESTNQVAVLSAELHRARQQLDIITAMREALDVIGDDDLLWLKGILYQYKINKSVTLKVTHGSPLGAKKKARAKQLPPNGFIAMPRSGDPEGYACTSLGGLALAEYYEEAMNSSGSPQAMSMLMRAFWKHLPGASE